MKERDQRSFPIFRMPQGGVENLFPYEPPPADVLDPIGEMRQQLPVRALFYLSYGKLKSEANSDEQRKEAGIQQQNYYEAMDGDERNALIQYISAAHEERMSKLEKTKKQS